MKTSDQVQALLHQITSLPDEAQAELLQSLIESRAEDSGIYHLDADEHAALARHVA